MWQHIRPHQMAILLGLKLRRIKLEVECLLGIVFLASLIIAPENKNFLSFLILVSAGNFIIHLLLLRHIGFFKACHYYGYSGHTPSAILKRLIL